MKFTRAALLSLGLLLSVAVLLPAQAPTGGVVGVVTDESGAVIPNAAIAIVNKDTGATRNANTSGVGYYSVVGLPAGTYGIKTSAPGFQTRERAATVETGSNTRVDFKMKIGATTEVVQVEDTAARLDYESHKIDAVINRTKIQELPLNGRNFLQLAFLEPGVTVGRGSTSQYNAQTTVSILGAGANRTGINVDGGNIRNSIEGGSSMNFSQEVVQEFQISSVNFDVSTGITGAGSINIVTRGGSNQFHGAGYFFYRDHNMAAYPNLDRSALTPDPFFARRQPGFWFGGPIKKERAFFFFNFEHNNQDNALLVNPNDAALAPLRGVATTPYTGKQLSVRFDLRINDKHNAFARYSHDGNNGFGPNSGNPGAMPSNWLVNTNFADHTVFGLTSAFTSTMTNDFRFSYSYWRNRNLFPTAAECPGCVGLGLPEITDAGGSNFVFGNTQNATQGRDLRKFQFTNTYSWQKGSHRLKFGAEFEKAPGTGFWGFCDPACGAVYGPGFLRSILPAALIPFFRIPDQIRSTADLLTLPLAGAVFGIGNPSQPPPYNVETAKKNNRIRFYGQDTWRVNNRLTFNYGLSWNYESTLWNHDLDKGTFLRPIMGDTKATNKDKNNFAPQLGFSYALTSDNRTVLRAGAGLFYDTSLLFQRLRERALIGPLGNGRVTINASAVPNPIPNIPAIPGLPAVPVGTPLLFDRAPTGFNLGHLMSIINPTIAALTASFPAGSSLAVLGIDVAKQGADLIPINYPAQYSEHVNIGVQRELARNWVLNADFVFRQFMHQEFGPVDYNRFQAANRAGPVIPRCTGTQAANPAAQCSTGPITVRTPGGRTNYKGLLIKLDKRMSNRFQFTSSYALQSQHGMNGIWNLDNWFSSWGNQGARHVWNFSGIVQLPMKFEASFISQISTKGPVMPVISQIDLDGDGTSGEPIPGVKFNGFNRGFGKPQLASLVDSFNTQFAGRTINGRAVPRITLPANYQFGDNFYSQDVRLTKFFKFRERYELRITAELFNLFNIANLTGFSMSLNNPLVFGQPTGREGQTFGSGGPRALQLGVRFSF